MCNRQTIARRAFTLIELLVVIAIIMVLAGLLIGIGWQVVTTSKERVAQQRVEELVRALSSYAKMDRSAAAALQQYCHLGGVVAWAPCDEVIEAVRQDQPPVLVNWRTVRNFPAWAVDACGPEFACDRYYPPAYCIRKLGCFYTPGSRATNKVETVDDGYSATKFNETVGRDSLHSRVLDVVPPSEGPIPQFWYETVWPKWWPLTNWDQEDPPTVIYAQDPEGAPADPLLAIADIYHPPVLRFPWGDPGLRTDGNRVDPAVPADEEVGSWPRAMMVDDWRDPADLPIWNGWACYGRQTYNNPSKGNFPIETTAWPMLEATGGMEGSVWLLRNPDKLDWTSLLNTLWGKKWEFPYPGREDLIYRWRSDVWDSQPASEDLMVRFDPEVLGVRPQPFDMGLMSPIRSIQLLQASGLLPPGAEGREAYRSDRTPGRPWNDPWGMPLVIVYALWQPERFELDMLHDEEYKITRYRDRLLKASQREYGRSRSLYLAIGCPGPELDDDVLSVWNGSSAWSSDDDAKVLRMLWRQVRRVCKAHEWDEDLMAGKKEDLREEWDPMRKVEENGFTCMVSTVMEIE